MAGLSIEFLKQLKVVFYLCLCSELDPQVKNKANIEGEHC